jgi:DNA primase
MSIDLEEIRSRNPIETLIGERFPLRKSGSRYVGQEHDSLVVVPNTGFYFWNSKGEQGDVFDFVGRHVLNLGSWNNRDSAQFTEALRYLAHRAGITLEENPSFKKSPAYGERQLVERLHETLMNHAPALAYVTQARGWNPITIRSARLGYMPQDKRSLLKDLTLSESWQAAIEKFPAGMIVYTHLVRGRLMYLSGRSMEGKQHYNVPREILGERQPYYNYLYSPQAEQVVIVEGQADAITFAEWGIPAVAIGGMSASDDLLKSLRQHKRLFVALDNTNEANAKSREMAIRLGGQTYLPQLPHAVKDANDWLAKYGANATDVAEMLNQAQPWLTVEIHHATRLDGIARQDAIRQLFTYAKSLDNYALSEFKSAMEELDIKARTFADLLKATQDTETNTEEAADNDMPEVLNDSIPILSPALGFRRDLAMVTVAIMERLKGNRLNIQPYLVTSTRELRRLTDEQIISLNGQEIALKVIPEGSEFLMRWRHSDIKLFLSGETVEPGDVFNAIHHLFSTYVDFRSEVESKILTLWVIGTYFYTMFPAYPYLTLNGPKNSGKSTVLRLLQPLAFNMITTSDPTGPAMFRLIHQTGCTVGIDEAERYHNPKDPAMIQIKQLLNSGYKHGMPAIRLIGENMKPQTFDVYSPKVMAAIMGLEDVLASRCLSIPMRRTDKKMPSFPSDFDGAGLRHQLYSLALTHFQPIYTNYFTRPDLHKLHNRSSELWSPLVALAAFFEEQGGIPHLLSAISDAASWDDQVSEGQSLSEREEAVLQALDLMTRHTTQLVWIKSALLRDKVMTLMGNAADKTVDGQWIGHVLKRLYLIDEARRKRQTDGIVYVISPLEVVDMMRRYHVTPIVVDNTKNPS